MGGTKGIIMMLLCSRVTGTSATGPEVRREFDRQTRLGEQRADGRWEVLCQFRASYRVGGLVKGKLTCSRCLSAVVDLELQDASETSVERL
jgi:hypothetical protein